VTGAERQAKSVRMNARVEVVEILAVASTRRVSAIASM
jgi:hypothetical protein